MSRQHPRLVPALSAVTLAVASTAGVAQQSFPPGTMADRLSFERLTIDDGLSQSNVLTVLQDHRGFMWFGTAEGLNKYDGYDFTIYRHDPADPSSLVDNYVEVLYEDRSGSMWVGTSNGGIHRFDPGQQRFTRFLDERIQPHGITWFYEDDSGRFWVATQGGGLLEMDRDAGRFMQYLHDPDAPSSLSDNSLWQVTQDVSDPDLLWVATENGLNRLNVGTGRFTRFHHDPNDPTSLSNDDVRALHIDAGGTLWVGTWGGGFNRFDREAETFTRFSARSGDRGAVGHDRVWDIEEDPSVPGTLWIATYGGGLLRFATTTERITGFRHQPGNPFSIGSDNLKALHLDRASAMWIGTWNGGVSKLDRAAKAFNRLSRLDGLTPHPVLAIAEDPTSSSTVWIGTWGGGLSRVDLQTGGVTTFRHDPTDPHSLSHDRVRSIAVDQAGTLWAGTDGGLARFDRHSESFTRFEHDPDDPNSLRPEPIIVVLEDPTSPGTLWIGLYDGGLQRFSVPRGEGGNPRARFVTFRHDPAKARSLSHDRVQALHFDRSDVLWVGTLGGLNRFDRDTQEFTRFRHDPEDPESLSHNSVLAIQEAAASGDRAPVLWVGTDDGLNRLEPDPSREDRVSVTRYGEADGLPSTVIYGILQDEKGRLWLPTNKGLSRFDPSTGVFTNYDVTDGLQSNEFEFGSVYRSRSGWMFAGGINGFNVFHPDSIRANPNVPPVVLTGMRINNARPDIGGENSPLRQHITQTRELTLSHEQNVVSLEFAALDYTAPHKNRYAYRMEGFDDDWQDGGNRRFATYTNLDPGKYVFRVRGSNGDGIWNEQEASLQLTILPPWWRTWWAYALYGMAALSLLYASRRYELTRIRLKNQLELEHLESQKLRELDTAKSRFFANLSHEFRTPLTLTIGPLEDLRSGIRGRLSEEAGADLDLALRNSRRLLRLVNQMLDVARLEAGQLEPRIREDDLGELLRGVAEGFAPLAERRNIHFNVDLPDLDLCFFFDADLMEKVLTNLLSNAFKFTEEGGTVRVSLEEVPADEDGGPSEAVITVRDSGSGIGSADLPHIFERFYRAGDGIAPGTGIGLSLAKELVELHGGRIDVSSEPGFGSTFRVHLRRGHEHLSPAWMATERRPETTTVAEPFDPESERASAYGRERLDSESDLDRTTILVVDDNGDVRAYLKRHLSDSFRVLEAPDGHTGLELARDELPDVVISDIVMDGLSGLDFCAAIRSDPATSFMPFILVTALASPDEKLAGLAAGADDYVTKPFDPIELGARVRNLVQARRRLWQHVRYEARLHPEDTPANTPEERFLDNVRRTIEAHLDDESFDVEALAASLGYSRASLYRRLQGLVEDSPAEIILNVRLERAAQLLQGADRPVSEIAYAVGFKSVSHFSRRFKRRFGASPSEYRASPTT